MKSTLLFVILNLSSIAHSQQAWEFNLSKNSKNDRMGTWEQGDYKIYVELDKIRTFLSLTAQE